MRLITHIPSLDGLRGVAILLVMALHLSIVRSTNPFDQAVLSLLHSGWAGVDLFFVLSGFLITGILLDARHSERYFRSFYTRRTLRLFPLYYLVIFLSYHVLPRFPEWENRLVGVGAIPPEWTFWLYLSNFAVAEREQFQHGVLFLSWSLAIEEQFYLAWAPVVRFCRSVWLGRLCVLLLFAAPLLRAIASASGASPIEIYVLTPYRADALAAGGWLAWRLRQPNTASLTRHAPWVVVAGAIALVILATWDGRPTWDQPVEQSLGYSFLALTASGLLLCAATRPQTSLWVRFLSAGWLRAIGRYSYCLYLIHTPVMWTMRDLVFNPQRAPVVLGSALPAQLAFWPIAAVPAFFIAWLSWRWFEAPILRLKRYFPY